MKWALRSYHTLALIFVSFISSSQNWQSGEITSNSGETVVLTFKMDNLLLEGMLIVQDGEKQYTLTPRVVSSFTFEDAYGVHLYESKLLYVNHSELPQRIFLEVIHKGEISLYRRTLGVHKRRLINQPLTTSSAVLYEFLFVGSANSVLSLYTDWALFDPGRVKFPKPDKRKLFELMGRHKPQIKHFIRNSNLNLSKIPDLIEVLSYYDSLMSAN